MCVHVQAGARIERWTDGESVLCALGPQVLLTTFEESIESIFAESGAGISQRHLLEQYTSVILEAEYDGAIVLGSQDEAHSLSLGDLDLVEEYVVVVVAEGESGDGHDLRDGAEGEDGGILQVLEVVEAVDGVLEGIGDEFVQASESVGLVVVESQVLNLVRVFGPDGARPEETRGNFAHVLEIVADDVRLLQEETHGVTQRLKFLRAIAIAFDARGTKQTGETMTDQTSNIVAIQLPIGNRFNRVIQEVGHAVSHALADIGNDVLIHGLQLSESTDQLVVLLQQVNLMRLVSDCRETRAGTMSNETVQIQVVSETMTNTVRKTHKLATEGHI